MVMLLSLLVYGIAERRPRAALKEHSPNQINEQTERPTLRWIFQLLHSIHYLKISVGEQVHYVIEGLTALREKILRFFGESVAKIYQISFG